MGCVMCCLGRWRCAIDRGNVERGNVKDGGSGGGEISKVSAPSCSGVIQAPRFGSLSLGQGQVPWRDPNALRGVSLLRLSFSTFGFRRAKAATMKRVSSLNVSPAAIAVGCTANSEVNRIATIKRDYHECKCALSLVFPVGS